MTIGVSSYVYRWNIGVKDYRPSNPMSALGLVRKVADSGIGGVQFCDHLNLDFSSSEIDEMNVALQSAGLFAEIGAGCSNLMHLQRMIQLARALGSRLIRVVPSIHRTSRYDTIREQMTREIKRIHEVLSFSEGEGIAIALENHTGLLAVELREIVERIDSPRVGVCLDTMNSVALLESPEETVRELWPFALTVHLKDFRVISSPISHVITGTALGDGIVPFGTILGQLRRSDRILSYHIEHYIDRCDRDADLLDWEQASLERSLRYAIDQLGFEPKQAGGK